MEKKKAPSHVDIRPEELGKIIDKEALQSLMDDFYAVTGMGIGIVDLKGNILVGTGWQDICVKFHRINPQALKNCIESDLILSRGVEPGKFKAYKCRNNLWDIATPIFIGNRHVGNVFLGQFFYDDEEVDYQVFAGQAERYGFDKDEYLNALKRIPVWSRDKVRNLMNFYAKFATLISKLSYTNLELARAASEHRRAEQRLKRQFMFRNQLLETIPNAIFYKDTQGIYRGCNRAFERLLGRKRSEIVGKSVYDIYPRALADIYHLKDQELFDNPGVQIYESLIRKSDGTERNVQFSKGTYFNPDGSVDGLIGVVVDITEHKHAEERLLAHLHFLESLEKINVSIRDATDLDEMMFSVIETARKIFDSDRAWLLYPCDPESPTFRVPVISTNPDLPDTFVPANIELPMGAGGREICSAALASDTPIIYGEGMDKPVCTQLAEQFGVSSLMVYALYPKMARPWIFGMHQCSHARVWTGEEQELFREIGRRITDGLTSMLFLRDLRENEERFRATFEQAAVGIAHVALDGHWLRVNQKLCDIVGYSREELLQMTVQQITHPRDLDAVQERVRQLLAGEASTYSMENRYIRKDGSVVSINLTVSSVCNASGDPVYLISVIEDITLRKKAEEEQEKLHAQFVQAQKMESVGRLAGGVAHDFNNMLGVILGHVELAIAQLEPNHSLRTDLEEIQNAAQRSADLTSRLLAFARKQTVSPKVLDLNDTLTGMLSMLRRLLGEDIDLSWAPGADLWPIYMDPSQIDQVLANLCVNARDAISGVGKIVIATSNTMVEKDDYSDHADSAPGEYVLLTVCDDGCGMEREVLEHLFEPFFTTKSSGEGTGLGLATVYGIVTQNKGFISVHSEKGQGTTFRIYLPRHREKFEQVCAESPAEEAASGGPETILLVEDEPAFLNLCRTMLEKLGYQVLAAATPGEAVQLAEEHAGEINLLLSDVVMPEMNGRDLAKRLLSLYPHLKRVFMSGYTADVIAHRGVLEENVCFLQKPFSMRNLDSKIREALQKE